MTVRRRKVFYIPGFDPFPPRRYRELYRAEGAAQAQIAGYELHLRGQGGACWQVQARIDGAPVETQVEVLVWSDLVQASMGAGIAQTYVQMLRTAWIYVRSGALRRLMWLRKGPVLAALYPIGMLVVQALLAALLAYGVWRMGAGVSAAAAAVLALAVGYAVLAGFRRIDRHLFAYYLMHDYAFTARDGGAYPPQQTAWITDQVARLQEALDSEVDEVLVVGHSSGAHLAISIVAELLGQTPAPERLSLLTLAHVVPMVSFLPRAGRLRRDLQALSARADLTWVDVSAPGDGACFALCDPVAVSGVAPAQKHGPLVISAAFRHSLSAERWEQLKRRYFRLHFQYLCAFDDPSGYDYFRITAGPQRLVQVFAGRKPSPSRIDVAASPYTDMTL